MPSVSYSLYCQVTLKAIYCYNGNGFRYDHFICSDIHGTELWGVVIVITKGSPYVP